MDELLGFLKLIARRLDRAKISYMITGSMAQAVYAIPRMTRDIDLVVEIEPGDAERFVALFNPDCVIDLDAVRNAIAHRSIFNIIHSEWVIKADFIVRKDTPFRHEEFGRRRSMDIDGAKIALVSREDLILSKLDWGKASGSELQQRDVRQLLQSGKDLDHDYMTDWARKLSVLDLLNRLRA